MQNKKKHIQNKGFPKTQYRQTDRHTDRQTIQHKYKKEHIQRDINKTKKL